MLNSASTAHLLFRSAARSEISGIGVPVFVTCTCTDHALPLLPKKNSALVWLVSATRLGSPIRLGNVNVV